MDCIVGAASSIGRCFGVYRAEPDQTPNRVTFKDPSLQKDDVTFNGKATSIVCGGCSIDGLKEVTTFVNLPSVVIEKVFSYLSPYDLSQIRVVSKDLCAKIDKQAWCSSLRAAPGNFSLKARTIRSITPELLIKPLMRILPSSDEITDSFLKKKPMMVSGFYLTYKNPELNDKDLDKIKNTEESDLSKNATLLEILTNHPDQDRQSVIDVSIIVLERIRKGADQCSDLSTFNFVMEVLTNHPNQDWRPLNDTVNQILVCIRNNVSKCSDPNILSTLLEMLLNQPHRGRWEILDLITYNLLLRIENHASQCNDPSTLLPLLEFLQKQAAPGWDSLNNTILALSSRIHDYATQCYDPVEQIILLEFLLKQQPSSGGWQSLSSTILNLLLRIEDYAAQSTDLDTLDYLMENLQKHSNQEWRLQDTISAVQSARERARAVIPSTDSVIRMDS